MAPEAREENPEGSVQGREPRLGMTVNVNGQLLTKCQLYDCLVLSIPE